MIEYKNEQDAEGAYTNFISEYLPELSEKQVVKIEDNTFTAANLNSNLIIIVFNAQKGKDAFKLIQSVLENLK